MQQDKKKDKKTTAINHTYNFAIMPTSIPSLPTTLTPPLVGREAIADAVYRCVMGLDTNDLPLFQSAFTNDAIFDLNGTIMAGFDAINAQCFASISNMDTNHFITNLRINLVDQDSKVQVTCSALAQHYRGGEGMKPNATQLLAGSLYWLDMVKDAGDGLWKIKKLVLKSTWGQGDWAVFSKETSN